MTNSIARTKTCRYSIALSRKPPDSTLLLSVRKLPYRWMTCCDPDILFLLVGVPRKVLSPFTFSDGVHVPSGNWVCVPQQALMQDPANYPDPMTFDGFRFANGKDGNTTSESRFSHPSWRFPFWGSVKQAW